MHVLSNYWWILPLCLIPLFIAVIYFLAESGEKEEKEKRMLKERIWKLEEAAEKED